MDDNTQTAALNAALEACPDWVREGRSLAWHEVVEEREVAAMAQEFKDAA
jgi:hypothetical protein